MTAIRGFRGENRWLSNFWSSDTLIEMDGEMYVTVEHAYQAAKTLIKEERAPFQRISKGGDAKRMGRAVTKRPNWEDVKLDVMLDLLRKKFRDPLLRAKLLSTGEAELVEENNWDDRFWGTVDGVGKNHLGKLLMRVREELVHEVDRKRKLFRYFKARVERVRDGTDIIHISGLNGTPCVSMHTSPSAVATDLRAIVRWLEQLALEEKKPWTLK